MISALDLSYQQWKISIQYWFTEPSYNQFPLTINICIIKVSYFILVSEVHLQETCTQREEHPRSHAFFLANNTNDNDNNWQDKEMSRNIFLGVMSTIQEGYPPPLRIPSWMVTWSHLTGTCTLTESLREPGQRFHGHTWYLSQMGEKLSSGEISDFYAWQMWRNLNFLHIWSNLKFFHI